MLLNQVQIERLAYFIVYLLFSWWLSRLSCRNFSVILNRMLNSLFLSLMLLSLLLLLFQGILALYLLHFCLALDFLAFDFLLRIGLGEQFEIALALWC